MKLLIGLQSGPPNAQREFIATTVDGQMTASSMSEERKRRCRGHRPGRKSHESDPVVTVIERLWADQPGKYFCLSTKNPEGGRWNDYLFARDEIDIVVFARGHRRHNVYFCPHGFARRRRVKSYAVLPAMLWADLDEADPRTLKGLSPTVAIESSPGRYVGLWLTDRAVTEELNRRLTYHIGADKGGWDLTQMLRVPGTLNYKYDPPVRVTVLWEDGPRYEIDDLERRLPALPAREAGSNVRKASALSARAIIEKYILRHWVKRELLKGAQVGSERRHRMHWKLGNELYEAGVPAEEAFVLLWATGWNKHQSSEPVWNMIDKIWNCRAHGRLP